MFCACSLRAIHQNDALILLFSPSCYPMCHWSLSFVILSLSLYILPSLINHPFSNLAVTHDHEYPDMHPAHHFNAYLISCHGHPARKGQYHRCSHVLRYFSAEVRTVSYLVVPRTLVVLGITGVNGVHIVWL